MCGRYIIIDGRKTFATFDLLKELDKKKIPYMDIPRYNAAPMQKLPIVVQREDGIKPLEATWWLIPHWSKTGKPDTAFPSFNARADRIDTSKLFAPYFKSRRCLVPADGFYEWKKISDKEKQPMCIRMRQDDPFMMAGVFSIWKDEKEEEHPSFSIITTEPNSQIGRAHV